MTQQLQPLDEMEMSDAEVAVELATASEAPLRRRGGKGIRVRESRVYRGPNPYGYRPVVRCRLDLGDMEDYPTTSLPGFTDRLLETIPTLHEHGCSYGHPGGFVQRLHEGTWLSHVAEHVALELQCLAGTPVTYGKTRTADGERGVYDVVYSFREERVGLLAGWLSLRLINSLLPPELQGIGGLDALVPSETGPLAADDVPFDFQAERDELIRVAERLALGPTTMSIVEEARRRDIPAIRLDENSFVQLGYGKYQQRIRASVTSKSSHLGVETAGNKELTKQLLEAAGLPIPRGALVRSADEAVRAADRLGYPLVTKPLDANHGRGVSLELMDAEQVRWGFEQAAKHSRSVLVEQHFKGHDYRILVVNGQVIAAARRVPAHVVGDGKHTIAQLVEHINQDPRRGIGHEKVLTRITIDAQAERLLDQAGHTLETVLPEREVFYLRPTANMSTGGTAVDCTDQLHPDNVEIFSRAVRIVGLDVAGIDVISPDITRSLCETGGGIIEINAGPGFRMHLQPSEGKPRNVARPVIDLLFPHGTPTRVPIVAITGTNGKTTTSRMVAHILQAHGQRVGLTTSHGIYINGELYESGDTTGPKSARMVLRDPTIEAAVLETARGGILREGLGFDRCDVGAVLNVTSDHLGLKGVDTLEDMARIKALIVEVVRRDGYSVLNADDPLTVKMRRKAEGKIIFFSMRGGEDSLPHLRDHIADGGIAVVCQPGLRGDMIAIYDREEYLPLMWTCHIPATLDGKARHNVENALAATAIAYALHIPLATIREALGTFNPSFEDNPGRLNVFDGHGFRVIMDYAHNPSGMAQMAALVKKLRTEGSRVLVMFSATGDRRDEDIRELGRIAAGMADELIIKDTQRRGRSRGEGPHLLQEGARAAGMAGDKLTFVENEPEAVDIALRRARPGDLVLLCADETDRTWKQITSFQPALETAEGGSESPREISNEAPSVGEAEAEQRIEFYDRPVSTNS